MKITRFNPYKWIYYGQWEQPPFSSAFWVYWFQKQQAKKLGITGINGKVIMMNGSTIINKKDVEILKQHITKACRRSDKTFLTLFSRVVDEILRDHRLLLNELAGINYLKNRRELFRKVINSSLNVMTPWYIAVIFSDHMEYLIVEAAEKIGTTLDKIIDQVPKKETLLIKQHREAIRIKKIAKKQGVFQLFSDPKFDIKIFFEKAPRLLKHIECHVRTYAWVGTHHWWGKGLTVKSFIKSLVDLREEFPAPSDSSRIHPKLKFIMNAAAKMSYYRQYIPEVYDEVAFAARGVLQAIARDLKLTYDELLWLTPEEVWQCLNGASVPTQRIRKARKKGVCIFMERGKEKVVAGKSTVSFYLKQFVSPIKSDILEIKGDIASTGFARGKVKIFLVPEKFSKMEKGDILVTPMTTPDFVPLMKKAGAIVTDIGGRLSHAGIISREMHKPCIVGTRIATRVLHDGQMIEVDAHKGIIKICN